MKKYIDGLKIGGGIITMLMIFMVGMKFINAWSGNDSLTATNGDTLTAEKWNTLVNKLDGIKSIQNGTVGNGTAGNAGGLNETNVTFPITFSKVPNIILTIDESIDGAGGTGCRIQSKSVSGFSYRCRGLSAGQNIDMLNWIAIEPY
ncbi:MAG: hypothetical protein V3575_04335 [Candidatus Absconditabacteria bacterium]